MTDSSLPQTNPRRQSVTLNELYAPGRPRPLFNSDPPPSDLSSSTTHPHSSPPSSSSMTAAAQTHRRRTSIGTNFSSSTGDARPSGSILSSILFGTSPTSRSGNSLSDAPGLSMGDESAIEDDNEGFPASSRSLQNGWNTAAGDFARRGSLALRSVRAASMSTGSTATTNGFNGRDHASFTSTRPRKSSEEMGDEKQTRKGSTSVLAGTSPIMRSRDPAFNNNHWADTIRTRAERSASLASSGGYSATSPNIGGHSRARSINTTQPTVVSASVAPVVPDHFQERILKGDFYMD